MYSDSSQFTPYTLSSANFIWISPLYNLHSAIPFVNMSALTSETPSHFEICLCNLHSAIPFVDMSALTSETPSHFEIRLCNLHSAIPFVNLSVQDISNVY